MALKYVSTLDLAKEIGIKNDIPNWQPGTAPVTELVGTGDNVSTIFYLDQKNVISSTDSLAYGASRSATTALTPSTHYDINLDSGKITLTAAGVIAVATNYIYGEYSYYGVDFSDSHFTKVLERAETRVNNEVGSIFCNGTAMAPFYGQVIDEKQSGKGKYDRDYYTKYTPLPDVLTNLTSNAATSDTSLNVQSTWGFGTAGFLCLETDSCTYTGRDGSVFTGVSGLDSQHTAGTTALPYIVEVSTTDGGTRPSWSILDRDVDYDMDLESGRIHVYDSSYLQYPPRLTPNRFRVSYIYGYESIPGDIKRLTLLFAKQMLINDTISKSLIAGRNEFRPELLAAEAKEMQDIIDYYASIKISNI